MKQLLLSDRTHVFILLGERTKKEKEKRQTYYRYFVEERKRKKQKTTDRRLLGEFFFRSVLCVGLERLKKKSLTVVGFEPTPQVTST